MKTASMCILIVIFFTYLFYLRSISEGVLQIQTYFCFDETFNPNDNTQNIPIVFKKTGLKPVKDYKTADIIFTYKHDHFFELDSIPYSERCKYIYGLRSVNLFASKGTLPLIVPKDIVPKTWVLKSSKQRNDLITHFSKDGKPTKQLLLKSNQQRQIGLKMVSSIDDVIYHENYVVCQEILKDPFLVNKVKIDIRVYVLIVCNFEPNMYIFNDGFIYYAKSEYTPKKNSIYSRDSIISSGYTDRKIYENNPLTLQDLFVTIGPDKANRLQKNIRACFEEVFKAYYPILKNHDTNDGTNRFILLGADISPDKDLNVKLLEMNKGPDLKAKDERDKKVKEKMVQETMNILKNPSSSNPFFTKIM